MFCRSGAYMEALVIVICIFLAKSDMVNVLLKKISDISFHRKLSVLSKFSKFDSFLPIVSNHLWL